MPRINDETKQDRLDRLKRLLRQHRSGLAESEVADLLGLERRSINNYLRELELEGVVDKDGLYWMLSPYYEPVQLHRLDLSPEQTITLYLATRLLVKQSDKRNEAAESALYKLADMLTGEMSVSEDIRRAAQALAERPGDRTYSSLFETVVRGYLWRREIEIEYAPRRYPPFQTVVRPYLLEPSAIGFTTYLIGYSSTNDALRSLKLERIRRAALTDQSFDIPPDFPGLDLLTNAWSIIFGDDLVEVILIFHPSVVNRVMETRWHPSEQKSPDPERPNWLRWSARVADTTDMLPWVRGWGADVEVIAPQELRDQITGEARALAQLYNWHVSDQSPSDEPDHSRFNRIFKRRD